jgi:hypothetical protein
LPIKKSWRLIVSAAAVTAVLTTASPALAATAQAPPPLPPLDDTACALQPLSQPLLAFGDTNYYVLAPGGTFSSAAGWYLTGGATIASTVQPDGSTGGVLALPSKAQASSPVMCITNDFPMARLFARTVTGGDNVFLNVQYWRNRGWTAPKYTGAFTGAKGSWKLSGELPIAPSPRSGWQQVRFTLLAGGKNSKFQIDNFWVDPRASR